MSTDGSDIRKLSTPSKGEEDYYPTWSPDGRTIVFQRDASTGPTTLVAVSVRTGAERLVYRLPRWAPGSGLAAFSPNGKRILFGFWCTYGDSCPPSSRSPRNAMLATIRPDGLRRLPLGVHADSAAWAPDGTRIAFRCHGKDRAGFPQFMLCTSRLDGSELKRFPWVLDSVHRDWGPPS